MSGGLCIQIISPAPGQAVPIGGEVPVRVLVALACGCPIGAGGRYDYRRFRLQGTLIRDGHAPEAFGLNAGGGAGEFTGRIAVAAAGDHRLTIEAYDPDSGLAGRAHATVEGVSPG